MRSLFRMGTRKQRRQRNHVLIALGVSALFLLIVAFVQPFAKIQWWLSDQLFLPTTPSSNVVIVAVDDASLAKYGRLPDWPRSLHAQAIDNLSQAEAGVIGFDVLFADPSADDSQLADAIARAGNVVLPVVGVDPMPSQQPEVIYKDYLFPVPALRGAAVSLGHANVVSDGDGVMRKIPLVVSDIGGVNYSALVLAMLSEHLKEPLPEEYIALHGSFHLLDRDIPVDDKGQMRINFAGEPGSFTRLSYADVIDGNFDPNVVKHKIVLVGVTATGEPDSWVTPISAEKMYGVEIYANAMDTILKQRFLTDSSRQTSALIVLLMAGITSLALPLIRLRWGTLLVVVLFLGYGVAVFLAFDHGYILNILYPLMVLPIIYLTVLLCRVIAAQAERRHINELFGRYVSPQVAGEILNLANTDQLKLGGVRREVTVLFADMRGFTALSERLDPESVVAMLNKYLGLIIECVLANEGMVNKFAGDNIMAVWNAPEDQPTHALLAVKAALEAQQAIENMPQDESLPKVEFGMGMNTGPVVAGNVGSEGRTEYTIIGDTVNLASRLCTNAPGGHIWLGLTTYEQVKDAVEVEVLEPQRFKGKMESTAVYRALRLRSREKKDE
jgi:adenylate cyclase